jgi:hypothetical protein
MSDTYNIARTRLGDWDICWNSVWLGSVDKVTVDLKLKLKPIKVGSMGDAVLGMRIIGLEGTVKAELREIDLTQYQNIIPWSGTVTTALQLTPPVINADLYSYAHLLKLHPNDVGDATQDINLAFATPTFTPMSRDGVKDDLILAEWQFFPDRSQLPVKYYGYIGP